MRSRGHGEVEHRTGRVLTLVNSLCRNHHSTAVFEREGKSVATEQGAGWRGATPRTRTRLTGLVLLDLLPIDAILTPVNLGHPVLPARNIRGVLLLLMPFGFRHPARRPLQRPGHDTAPVATARRQGRCFVDR